MGAGQSPHNKGGYKMKVEKWYDRYSRNWIIQLLDAKGNQIGNAVYVYTKNEAIREVELLKRENNL